jgi:hypothetical protein
LEKSIEAGGKPEAPEKKIPEKEFTIQKLSCTEPVQLVEFLVSLKSVSPEHISMTVLKIADKVYPDHALVFDFDYNISDWGIAMLLLNIETVDKPWVGVCDRRRGVVVVSGNSKNLKVGDVIPLATLKIT